MSAASMTSVSRASRSGSSVLRIAVSVLLCLPSILGTTAMWMVQGLRCGSDSHLPLACLVERGAEWFFLMATYGPLMLIVAVPLAVVESRKSGMKSAPALTVWAALLCGMAATAAFYWRLMWTAALP